MVRLWILMNVITKGKRSSKAGVHLSPFVSVVGRRGELSGWELGSTAPCYFPQPQHAVHYWAAPKTSPWFCHCSHAAFLVLGCFVGLVHHTGMSIPCPT